MSTRDLDAAGITDPGLRDSYELCRQLNKKHGKTYYLATLLLPPAKRPYVHALYGFARYADEIVDDMAASATPAEREAHLRRWGDAFLRTFDGTDTDDPVCRAVLDTVRRWGIPRAHFEAFLDSMAMDLTVTEYATFDDLRRYIYGSAAVIGLQMVPILEPTDERAYAHAQQLGEAFQLANFIRDVGEDIDRGRIYLPMNELARHGVTRRVIEDRVATPAFKDALREQIARVRDLEAQARPGIAMLDASAQPCIETARILYCGIVDAVEDIDFEVFDKRATVALSRRLAVAGRAWVSAVRIQSAQRTTAAPAR